MKNKMMKLFRCVLLLFLMAGGNSVVNAQCPMCKMSAESNICPMCKMSAESNMQNGGTDGRGLNAGIMYMLLMPYLIVGGIGYWWWRNRRQEPTQVAEFSEEDFQHYSR